MSQNIKRMYRKAGLTPPNGKGIHSEKFHRCVIDVTKKGGVTSPHAVCMASMGRNKAVKKSHWQIGELGKVGKRARGR
jgi:hypothetical protein